MNDVVQDSMNNKAEADSCVEEVSNLLNRSIGACADVIFEDTVCYAAAQAYATELYQHASECVSRVKIM